MPALIETELAPLTLYARGKVRDLYSVGERLLLVATDRISAFDHVLATGIPGKGKVLTQLSLFWFKFLEDIVPNHLITADVDQYPEELAGYRDELEGRSMLVKRAQMFPVECVVRGYLSGSGWKDYKATGEVCGIQLPRGLRESDRLPQPIFTPASKSLDGEHDVNISFDEMVSRVGAHNAERLRDLTLAIYKKASAYAEQRGVILADTKFEFGLDAQDRLVWMDEALTPDSSRFWPADQWSEGISPPSFDKQYLRDWLEQVPGWGKRAPPPTLPPEVVEATAARYREALQRLTA